MGSLYPHFYRAAAKGKAKYIDDDDDFDDFDAGLWIDRKGPSTSKPHPTPKKSSKAKRKPASDYNDEVYESEAVSQNESEKESDASEKSEEDSAKSDEEEEETKRPKAKGKGTAKGAKAPAARATLKKPAAPKKAAATTSAKSETPKPANSSVPMAKRTKTSDEVNITFKKPVMPVSIPGASSGPIRRVGLSRNAPARPLSPVRIPKI